MAEAVTPTCDSETTDRSKTSPSALPIRWNFLAVLVGRFIYGGCQWAILAIFARLGSPEDLGDFTLALAVTGPIFMMANLQLRYVIATDTSDEFRIGDYAQIRFWTTVAALLLVVGLAVFGTSLGWPLLLAMAATKLVECATDLVYGVLQRQERMDRIALLQASKGVVSIVAVATCFWLTRDVMLSTLALFVVWALHLLLFERQALEWITTQRLQLSDLWIKSERARSIAWVSVPLGMTTLLTSLNAHVPRYFIDYHWGKRELGFFAAITSLTLLAELVFRAASSAVIARLAKYVATKNQLGFWKLMGGLFGVAGVAGLIGVVAAYLFGGPILRLAYGPEYANYADVFLVLAVAMAVSYLASVGPALIALRRNVLFLAAWGVTLLSLMVAMSVLVPTHGLMGAAYAVLIANIVRLVAMMVVLIATSAIEFRAGKPIMASSRGDS